MNIYAVGDHIEITGQLIDSRGPFIATGLEAVARIVLDDYSAPAEGCDAVDVEWINEATAAYRVEFDPDNTSTIVPGIYVLEFSVTLASGKPISWYSGTFEIRASNIDET